MTLQNPDSSNNTIPCSQCPKQFPSQKALFGHMRCHPDRSWRGIHPPNLSRPPPSNQSNLRSSESDNRDHDTALFLLMLAGSSGGSDLQDQRKRKRRLSVQPVLTRFGHAPNRFMGSAAWGGVHECSICHKVFPTGQALGGHKRCHWARGERLNRVQGWPVLDLNEPAPLSEEDVEAAYGMVDVVPACVKSLKFVGCP